MSARDLLGDSARPGLRTVIKGQVLVQRRIVGPVHNSSAVVSGELLECQYLLPRHQVHVGHVCGCAASNPRFRTRWILACLGGCCRTERPEKDEYESAS